MAVDEDGLRRAEDGAARERQARRPVEFEFTARRQGRRLREAIAPGWSAQAMIAALIRWSIANRFLVLMATAARRGVGRLRGAAHAARCAARSLRRAGHHPHDLSGTGAAHRRGPGHLSADDDDAVGAGREDGARLFVLRRLVRLHPVRRRHRSVLGALARARVSQPGAGAAAGAGEARARARCDRRRLDLPVRARRPLRPARSRRSCARCRTGSSSTS